MQSKETFTFDDFSQRNIVRTMIFSSGFLLANNLVLRVLIGYNRQLLLIKIYAGISNIFKKVHHLLKLQASNKGTMLFPKFLKCRKLTQIKKAKIQRYHKKKLSRILIFLVKPRN